MWASPRSPGPGSRQDPVEEHSVVLRLACGDVGYPALARERYPGDPHCAAELLSVHIGCLEETQRLLKVIAHALKVAAFKFLNSI